jgi:hypothetical protein
MFHPKHVELFAGNKIPYKKSAIFGNIFKKFKNQTFTAQKIDSPSLRSLTLQRYFSITFVLPTSRHFPRVNLSQPLLVYKSTPWIMLTHLLSFLVQQITSSYLLHANFISY